MTEPAKYDEKTTPAVVLGGKKWPIPELGIRQLRIVRRPIIDLTTAIEQRIEPPEEEGGEPKIIKTTGDLVLALSTEQYELMCEVVRVGLTRAHPDMTEAEFLDLGGNDADIFRAFMCVRRQSGVYAAPSPDAEPQKAPIPGEAGAPSASQTGTE